MSAYRPISSPSPLHSTSDPRSEVLWRGEGGAMGGLWGDGSQGWVGRRKRGADRLRLPMFRDFLASTLIVALGACGMSLARAQVQPQPNGVLAFAPAGTNGFTFDTG